jgi:hypothetical protein
MSPASSHTRPYGHLAQAASAKEVVGQGRPPKLLRRRDDKHKPASVKELAFALPTRAWRTIMAESHG